MSWNTIYTIFCCFKMIHTYTIYFINVIFILKKYTYLRNAFLKISLLVSTGLQFTRKILQFNYIFLITSFELQLILLPLSNLSNITFIICKVYKIYHTKIIAIYATGYQKQFSVIWYEYYLRNLRTKCIHIKKICCFANENPSLLFIVLEWKQ